MKKYLDDDYTATSRVTKNSLNSSPIRANPPGELRKFSPLKTSYVQEYRNEDFMNINNREDHYNQIPPPHPLYSNIENPNMEIHPKYYHDPNVQYNLNNVRRESNEAINQLIHVTLQK